MLWNQFSNEAKHDESVPSFKKLIRKWLGLDEMYIFIAVNFCLFHHHHHYYCYYLLLLLLLLLLLSSLLCIPVLKSVVTVVVIEKPITLIIMLIETHTQKNFSNCL